MRGALLRNLSLYTRNLRFSPNLIPNPVVVNNDCTNFITSNAPIISCFSSRIRYFSSENDASKETAESNQASRPESESSVTEPEEKKQVTAEVQDVTNKELKVQIEDYFKNANEEALPLILESILKRRLSDKHEDTDDELVEELQMQPIDNVKDQDFESDFEEGHETDEEIDDLYSARDIVVKKMAGDPYFNMDDKKWDDMIAEAVEHGYLKDTRECEAILEDMLNWDKLLPDKIKKKVEKKFDEIGNRIEKGELEVEEGYALFKEFEDQMVLECAKLMEAEAPKQFDETAVPNKKNDLDDPPGEGPILRWQTRVVFAPGGDAWHPKNRKVKLAVTVKELGLSKHQFCRLRELAGKRYNPGKDELTITSERFEHREENRKDCLRTLFALIEEAGKARKLVEDASTSNIKERLKANPKVHAEVASQDDKNERIWFITRMIRTLLLGLVQWETKLDHQMMVSTIHLLKQLPYLCRK
ncbi:Ribosomal protein S24/S35 [Abeliophyllum distichum]|uniref:Ribosomal protein S24/S35 n=1 Tax=Abeliophyllum distichum TaxID=126358 RepID=A0ABD1PDZ2_9LAMI